MTDVVCSCV